MLARGSHQFLCRCLLLRGRSGVRFWNPRFQERLCSTDITGPTTANVTNQKSADTDQRRGPISSVLKAFPFFGKREAEDYDVNLHAAIVRLYNQCADVNFVQFIETFKMGDTFESWSKVTGLHVWFILLRLRQESEVQAEGYEHFRDTLMEVLWLDVKRRLDAISRRDHYMTGKLIKEQIRLYYSYLTVSMIELDEGIMRDDMVLAGALWRLFYKTQQINDIVVLNHLVRYVRMHVNKLSQRSMQDIIANGVTSWEIPSD